MVQPLRKRFPKELEAGSRRDVCTPGFTAAGFTMVAKCGWNSSAPEWMNEAARAAYTYSGVSALEEERNSHTG